MEFNAYFPKNMESGYYYSTLNVEGKNSNKGMKSMTLTGFGQYNKVYL